MADVVLLDLIESAPRGPILTLGIQDWRSGKITTWRFRLSATDPFDHTTSALHGIHKRDSLGTSKPTIRQVAGVIKAMLDEKIVITRGITRRTLTQHTPGPQQARREETSGVPPLQSESVMDMLRRALGRDSLFPTRIITLDEVVAQAVLQAPLHGYAPDSAHWHFDADEMPRDIPKLQRMARMTGTVLLDWHRTTDGGQMRFMPLTIQAVMPPERTLPVMREIYRSCIGLMHGADKMALAEHGYWIGGVWIPVSQLRNGDTTARG